MKVKVFVFLGLTAGLLMISGSVLAHHSNAPSDKDRLVTLTGTVTNFAFRNPHVSVSFDVTDGQGNVVTWFAAGTSPLNLARDAGWTNKTFTTGEQILVQGHPNRDGRPLLLFIRLYRCSGEMIPVDKESNLATGYRNREYITRVRIEPIEATQVQAVCAGSEQIPDILGPLARGRN